MLMLGAVVMVPHCLEHLRAAGIVGKKFHKSCANLL